MREKSLFSVKLTEFDTAKKIALIKEIKNLIPGTNLVQASSMVFAILKNFQYVEPVISDHIQKYIFFGFLDKW